MRSRESTAMADFDAYLDGVNAGQPNAAIRALAPGDLGDVDSALRELDDTPFPEAIFVDCLEESLRRSAALSAPSEAMIPGLGAVSNGPVRSQVVAPRPEHRSPGWPWAREQLATAALLVLTLIGSYLAFGGFRPEPARQQAPSISSPEPQRTLLLEVPLSRDAIPDPFDLVVTLFRIEPEREAIITADRWVESPGTSVVYVLSGQLSLRVEAPYRVVRADAVFEEVEAGTEVVLGIGDAAMFSFESARTYANPGTERVEFLHGDVKGSDWWPPGWPAGLRDLSYGGLTSLPASTIPATLPGPLVLRLESLVVASPELFPPSSAQGPDGLQASLLERAAPGDPTIDGQADTAYVLTLAPEFSSLGGPGLKSTSPNVAQIAADVAALRPNSAIAAEVETAIAG